MRCRRPIPQSSPVSSAPSPSARSAPHGRGGWGAGGRQAVAGEGKLVGPRREREHTRWWPVGATGGTGGPGRERARASGRWEVVGRVCV